MRLEDLALVLHLLLLPLVALARPGAASADPVDGLFLFSVLSGESGGPPYPAAPVEIAVTHRATGTILPSGRLLLIPVDATDASAGGPIALTASAMDDGAMGEPGETVVMVLDTIAGLPAWPGLAS